MKKKIMLDRNMNFYKGIKNNGNGKYMSIFKIFLIFENLFKIKLTI